MKKLLLFLLFSASFLFAQTDSLAAKYYPIKIGNEWQYEVITDALFDPDTTYKINSVIGDTLAGNGKKYFIRFIMPDSFFMFERFDSLYQKIFIYDTSREDSEYCLFDFSEADTVNTDSVGNLPIMANQLQIYYNSMDFFQWTYIFSESYGLSTHIYQGIGGYFEYENLTWMRIDSIEYGNYVTSTKENQYAFPEDLILSQNYPNPFNNVTIISFKIPERSFVRINIYNNLGQLMASLINKKLSAGKHNVSFEPGFLSSGIYYYQLRAEGRTQTKRMILLK